MRVYIIGAGPGAPSLMTVGGAELVARCPVVLYTGSLVPRELVATARQDARVLDTSSMTLDEIVADDFLPLSEVLRTRPCPRWTACTSAAGTSSEERGR